MAPRNGFSFRTRPRPPLSRPRPITCLARNPSSLAFVSDTTPISSANPFDSDDPPSLSCSELKEMQQRMASRQVYETSGRAYVLSGMSSHSWQRATARGDSTESMSLVHAYQTPSMVNMFSRSQTMGPPRSVSQPLQVRTPPLFLAQPEPR